MHPFFLSIRFFEKRGYTTIVFEISRRPVCASSRAPLRQISRDFSGFWGQGLAAPKFSVEAAVLDSFGHVGGLDLFGATEIGDGARHFQQAVVGTGGEAELLDGGA